MRRRLSLVLLALVVVPIGLLGGLGLRLAEDERALVRHEREAREKERLGELAKSAAATIGDLERRLLAETDLEDPTPEHLRALEAKEPLLRQTFVLDPGGRLLHPAGDALSEGERAFLARTRAIWDEAAILYAEPAAEAKTATTSARPKRPRGDSLLLLAAKQSHGFITWYWEEGVHLLFWRRGARGTVLGGEVERLVLLSRVLAHLPELDPNEGRIVLRDARGEVVWQLGAEEAESPPPTARLALAPPLDFLHVESAARPAPAEGALASVVHLNLLFGLGAVAIALLALALYLHRETTRELRDAAERVSFVTQVSHELKTPLTNIRLYAELVEGDLADDDERAAKRLRVIALESERLGRLINNILTFSRQQRGTLVLAKAELELDELVASVLEQFEPSLALKSVVPTFRRGGPITLVGDRDALGQILANLVGNVEKYAASGGALEVETARRGDRAVVLVRDRGPGVPAAHAEKIFEPFHRVSDRLADGVTGTGLGLTIARELARLHGGELSLVPSAVGACFELVIPIEEGTT